MIIRVTTKLGRKIGESPHRSLAPDANPFADWSADLFTADRTQYVIVVNTPSLYALVMYGRGITTGERFLRLWMSPLGDLMRHDGLSFTFERLVVPAVGQVAFSKALNRRVTGSMNDMIAHAKAHLTIDGRSPHETSFRLNEMPMSYLGHGVPRDAFRKLPPPED